MRSAYQAEDIWVTDADLAERIWDRACRQFRRDLHDSVGPLLSAVTMRTEAARAVVACDPEAAKVLLAELHADACHALAEVRRLAGTGPEVVLPDTGLGSALHRQADRFNQASAGRLAVSVTVAPSAAGAPAAVQTAVFRIVSEALTNTARHARAASCAIRVWADDAAVHVEVTDDGVGMPRRPARGVGLTSMRDRTRELGGSCLVENVVQHGTRVYAAIPVNPPASRTPAGVAWVAGVGAGRGRS